MLENILKSHAWFDHPEGIKFAETDQDAYRTVGHWLILPGSFSSFHRLNNSAEIWVIHAGRVVLHVVDSAGAHRILRLGLDYEAGERPVATVPVGQWQAAELPEGVPWAFGSNICAPGFRYSALEIGRRSDLRLLFPAHDGLITRLTRN